MSDANQRAEPANTSNFNSTCSQRAGSIGDRPFAGLSKVRLANCFRPQTILPIVQSHIYFFNQGRQSWSEFLYNSRWRVGYCHVAVSLTQFCVKAATLDVIVSMEDHGALERPHDRYEKRK